MPCYATTVLVRPSPRPEIHFPRELPITTRVRDLSDAIAQHQVVIVAGETGSGKTTQLPKIALSMGRERIGVTQPRRIAATSVADRVAVELGVELGREVGYRIRFADKTSQLTQIKFMTDGILLAEIQSDPLLRGYDTLILDEAHERSLNIDFLLGYLKRILPERKDLRVVISSATLATERFSAFFDGAPVVTVSGRTFPVRLIPRPFDDERIELADKIAEVVEEITANDPRGDILVFLPGEREIREASAVLHQHALPHTVVLPLYGRLSHAEQARIFQTLPERRIELATNVAETSLTIPGIVYVIDCGTARINRHDPRTGVTSLLVEPIAQSSANQRSGRAGRTQNGVCFRLYDRRDFEARPTHTDPEILRVGLAGAILQMKGLGLGELSAFPFLDPPPKRAVDEGYRLLEELGALDSDRTLTDTGKKLARLPVDPRIGRMILGGAAEGVLEEVSIIAAALGIQDPRDRPAALQKKADDAHAQFRDETSDFASLLKLWRYYKAAQSSPNQLRRICRDNFLNYVRLREWSDVHDQLSRIIRELALETVPAPKKEDALDAIHRALLPGLLSRIGTWHPEQRVYLGARQTRFQLHPSSGLARRKAPPWVVVAELVETTQLFARTAAKIDPEWLETAGGALCKRSFGEPHWAQKAARVMNKEQITLFGLAIVKDRKIHYGPIDPRICRRLFIVHALVRQEYAPPKTPPFITHNRALFEQLERLRDRARQADMIDDDAVTLFFEKRVSDDVYSGETFEAWRAIAEQTDPHILFLSLSDVLLDESADLSTESFPDSLEPVGLPLSYRFEPGEDDDGVTVTVPVAQLLSLDADLLEWSIPGWHREKIAVLCDTLPRQLRDAISKSDRAELAEQLRSVRMKTPMLPALSAAILERIGVRVPLSSWNLDDLPPYLRFNVRVVERTRTLAESRDLRDLQSRFAGRAQS